MPTVRQVRIAREFRANLTPAEATLWRELKTWRARGWRWRRQAPFQWWWLDFACFTHRMVVEVDGVHHELDPEQRRTTLGATPCLSAKASPCCDSGTTKCGTS